MKKSIGLLLLITLSLSILMLAGLAAPALAQPQEKVENLARPAGNRPAGTNHDLRLTGSNAYTLYLPIIVAPSPSPKKGVGARGSACNDMATLRISWYFKWSPFPDSTCQAGDARFVPRISTGHDMANLSQAVTNAQASGWLIGFTEPNLPEPGHADLSPAEAAVLWWQIEQAAGPAGIKLVSPSPSQHEPGWLWAMVQEYRARYGRNPRFDAIGWNIYKPTAGEIKSYLTARRNEALQRGYDVPIWVLEYGGHCQGSMASNETVMREITPWFDATSWIGRYAWFTNRIGYFNGYSWSSCSLINISTGVPTSLGRVYYGF